MRRGWVAVLVGAAVLFGCVGWMQVSDVYWLRQRGERTTATVVDMDTSGPSRPRGWIELRYVTRGGETVVQRTSRFRHYEGVPATIEVIYDREQPHRVQAADRGLDYTFELLLYTALTTVPLAAAVVLLLTGGGRAGRP